MRYHSTCRNCPCLHYFGGSEEDYPPDCYCVTAGFSLVRCAGYEPKDNLEYLEWCLKKSEVKNYEV